MQKNRALPAVGGTTRASLDVHWTCFLWALFSPKKS